jgi:hypothetical protein
MWVIIVSIVIVMVFLYWLLILKPGRLGFWKLAGKYPDALYDHFTSDNCWTIFEDSLPANYRNMVPRNEWDGPFRLIIPKLGSKMIYIFGRNPDYRKSQQDFVNTYTHKKLDLATTSTDDSTKTKNIDMEELKVQFRGRPLKQLIKHHLKKQNTQKLYEALHGTKEMLPQYAQSLATSFIDRWNERAYEKEFWQMDTSEVFSNITEDARLLLQSSGAPIDDEILFSMFQVVILNYACTASYQPSMQKFIE